MTSTRAKTVANRASNSTIVQFIARLGFFASGVIHILIGVTAIQVAVGGGGAEADQSGALSKLASAPGGVVLLWILVVGLTALGLWLIVNAFLIPSGDRRKRAMHVVTNLAKGIVYVACGYRVQFRPRR